MSQDKPTTREKRLLKDTPGIAQFRDGIKLANKRRDDKARNEALKAQGVGSTVPASRKTVPPVNMKATGSQEANTEESTDDEFDAIGAEIRAEEARVDALRAKLAIRDRLRYKNLRQLDEEDLQKLWDAGEQLTTDPKGKPLETPTSKKRTSQVQSIGPAQRIVSTTAPSTKRKRSSTSSNTKPKSNGLNGSQASVKTVSSNSTKGANTKGTKSKVTEVDSEGDSDGESSSSRDSEDEEGNGTGGEDDDEGPRKANKEPNVSKGGRGKTSDFTGTVKKMVNYTTVRVCAKLGSKGMFCSAREYKSLVAKSWALSAAEYGVDPQTAKYKLRKAHKQAIRARVNSFRSRIRDRLKPAIASVYELLATDLTPDEAKKHLKRWFPHGFHTKVGAAAGFGHFQHSFLQEAVFEAYFTGLNPVGITYARWFDPMPLEAIALVCAVIMWVIQQHETGKYVKSKMSFDKLRDNYEELMDSVRAFKTGKQADRCSYVQKMLFVQSAERAGFPVDDEEPVPADTALSEKDFAEDELTPDELKLITKGTNKRDHTAVRTKHRSSLDRQDSGTLSSPHPCEPTTSPAPRSTDLDDPPPHVRSSSVSLDQEESDPEDSCAGTPTPTGRSVNNRSQSDKSQVLTKQADSSSDDDDNQWEPSGSDTDGEAEDSQEPPSKKAKTTPSGGLVAKLVSGVGKKKQSPGTALAQKKLVVISSTSSQKPKPQTKLKIK